MERTFDPPDPARLYVELGRGEVRVDATETTTTQVTATGVHSDEEGLAAVLESTAARSLAPETAALFEQMATYHPTEPHWYLPLIGVDPAHQGEGHGDALMVYALARCDRDRAPAYLESSNPRNIPFYRRHGFEPLGAIQVGSSPTLVPMLRRPR